MLVPRFGARMAQVLRAAVLLGVLATGALVPACGNRGSGTTSGEGNGTDQKPQPIFEAVLLDDHPNPFAPLPKDAPKGLAAFNELVIFGPDAIEERTFVRLVIQPGETLPDAMKRARPFFDKITLPPGDRLVFSEIVEENEVTKKREAVGVRTYVATSTVILTHPDVAEASIASVPGQDEKPEPVAMLQLTPDASKRFAEFTRKSVLQRLAVMIRGNVVMAARIQEEITGGKISISLDPTMPYETKRKELESIASNFKKAVVKPPTPEATSPE